MKLKPWGPIEWLLPRTNISKWHVVTSSSFEDRCTALIEWMATTRNPVNSSALLRITNPPSDPWTIAKPFVEKNFDLLQKHLSGPSHHVINANLLGPLGSQIRIESLNPDGFESVLLDITTIPKRFFLFALKQLANSPIVKNLVVTYTSAKEYPESALCENALPPTALQGFGRVHAAREKPRMIVGVGYMPLSVEELLEQAKHVKLDFLFPFPPASPAFRRNWNLLSMLMPQDIPRNTEIHRIHGMDAFEVFERVLAWGENRDLDLLPLGPKPHALGMAMAYMRLDGHAELIYSQPQAYHHNYSKGIAKDELGRPRIHAYCLKLSGKQLF
jgi:hypothetical protein